MLPPDKLPKCQVPLLSLHRNGSVSLQDVEACVQQALLSLKDPFHIVYKSRRALKAVLLAGGSVGADFRRRQWICRNLRLRCRSLQGSALADSGSHVVTVAGARCRSPGVGSRGKSAAAAPHREAWTLVIQVSFPCFTIDRRRDAMTVQVRFRQLDGNKALGQLPVSEARKLHSLEPTALRPSTNEDSPLMLEGLGVCQSSRKLLGGLRPW